MPGPVATPMLKTPRPLPFTHSADYEAKYIVEQVFKGKKQIEPSWFYSWLLRILNWLPDSVVLKVFWDSKKFLIYHNGFVPSERISKYRLYA